MSKAPEDEEQNIGTLEYPLYIKKSELKKILEDSEMVWALNLWVRTKRWGLPYAGGWAEQPAWVMDILDAIEEADIIYRNSADRRT